MKIVSVILARGGSKGIKDKNIKPLHGKPLIFFTIEASNKSIVNETWVSTDHKKIAAVSREYGANVLRRPDEFATDISTSEEALIHFAKNIDFDIMVFIQPTSPLIRSEDINGALNKFIKGKWDSLLTLVRQHNFQWKIEDGEVVKPTNYDFLNRPRRQDHGGYMVENGAFYITTKEAFQKSKCRISGDITFYEMPPHTYFELDEESDIIILENLLERYGEESVLY
jgi:N-acylneuraminate cytidylyltransferase